MCWRYRDKMKVVTKISIGDLTLDMEISKKGGVAGYKEGLTRVNWCNTCKF